MKAFELPDISSSEKSTIREGLAEIKAKINEHK
jgi:hypothetical protein